MEDLDLTEIRSKLADHDLAVGFDRNADGQLTGFLVRGRTLQLNDLLSAIGGTWEAASSAWRLASLSQLINLMIELNHGAVDHDIKYDLPVSQHSHVFLCEYDEGCSHDARQLASRSVNESIRRLTRLPVEVLEPDELLGILLGLGTSYHNPQRLARELLSYFSALGAVLAAESSRYDDCLSSLLSRESFDYTEYQWELITLFKTMHELLQRVLKEKIKDRPVIGSWTALVDYLQVAMQHETAEHFRILFLDRKNILIRDEVQSRGTVDHTPLYPREVVKRALELAASAIIMVHNHPSGDPTPSAADIEMTKQVAGALGQVGIQLHDHIVVGKNRHASFRATRLI
jgi:DNA repair protein RadC